MRKMFDRGLYSGILSPVLFHDIKCQFEKQIQELFMLTLSEYKV